MEHPIQLVEDIREFMFPCPECGSEAFHVIGMRPYGLGVKIPFMKNPLATTHKAYFAVCARCDMINARLETADVEKLRNCIMPKTIHERYPRVASFYSLDMLNMLSEKFEDDPEMRAEWQSAVKAYRLE